MLGKAQNVKQKTGEHEVQNLKCLPQGYDLGTTENHLVRRVEKANSAGQIFKGKSSTTALVCCSPKQPFLNGSGLLGMVEL